MTDHKSHEKYIATQRQHAAAICQSILDGNVSIIEGSRQLLLFRGEVGLAEDDSDMLCFVAIDSDTDHLPVGKERKHWAAEALVKNDVEICKSEAFYRDTAINACKNLISKFETG